MRTVIICGGRDFADWEKLSRALDEEHATNPIGLVIHGAAPGADTLAESWAGSRSVKTQRFIAYWRSEGRAAGPKRNARMLAEGQPDEVLAFPGGKGTADMIRQATEAGVPVRQMIPSAKPA